MLDALFACPVHSEPPISPLAPGAILFAFYAFARAYCFRFLRIEHDATPLEECPACHYDLAGLPKSWTCPECGERYEPRTDTETRYIPRGGRIAVVLAAIVVAVVSLASSSVQPRLAELAIDLSEYSRCAATTMRNRINNGGIVWHHGWTSAGGVIFGAGLLIAGFRLNGVRLALSALVAMLVTFPAATKIGFAAMPSTPIRPQDDPSLVIAWCVGLGLPLVAAVTYGVLWAIATRWGPAGGLDSGWAGRGDEIDGCSS